MKHTKKIKILLLTAGLIVASCSGSRTVTDGKRVVEIPDRQINEITIAANMTDTEHRVRQFTLIDLKSHVGDPVMSNARGVAHLTNGDHQLAIDLFREAAESILREETSFVSKSSLPDRLKAPAQSVADHNYSFQDNATVVSGLKRFIDHGNQNRLLNAVFEWAEFTPVPPAYSNSGLAGIALESFNELVEPKPFQPYLISYRHPNLDPERYKWVALETVARNLATAGILAADRPAIEAGVGYLEIIPERNMTSTGRFIAGFGNYLLGSDNWDYFVHNRYRHMFH